MTERVLEKLKPEIQSMIDQLKEELFAIIQPINDNLTAFAKKLDIVEETANKALELAQENATAIQELTDHVTELQHRNEELQTRNTKLLQDRIKDVEGKLEDRTNRSLRKTLVIKGIREVENETWEKTEALVAEYIVENVPGYDLERAKASIERAHRSKPTDNPDKAGRRDIFAAFYDWKDSEFVKKAFIDANKDNHGLRIYFEQKFGGLTTSRRNLALAARKKLKADNKITSGYVAFPVRLMVKTSKNKSEKYHMHQDFSNEVVVFTKKKPGK